MPKACLSTISIITILSTLFLTTCLLSLSSKGNESNDASPRGGYFQLWSNYMQNNSACKLKFIIISIHRQGANTWIMKICLQYSQFHKVASLIFCYFITWEKKNTFLSQVLWIKYIKTNFLNASGILPKEFDGTNAQNLSHIQLNIVYKLGSWSFSLRVSRARFYSFIHEYMQETVQPFKHALVFLA